jgi:hypothetical protein
MTHRYVLGCLSVISLLTGCNRVTTVGLDCIDAGCKPISCTTATQQLPETCDRTTRTCNGMSIADEAACTTCGNSNIKLRVKSTPIAACACAHCAAQLRACFESADYEQDAGDPQRDTSCLAIVQCGWASHCRGSECYCGVGVDRETCLQDAIAGHPRGACADVITSTSGCAGADNIGNCVLGQQFKSGTLLYRATAVAQCVTGDPLVRSADITPQCADQYDQ